MSAPHTESLAPWHILLIDDSAADVHLLKLALDNAGLKFGLTVLEDGAEALAYARGEEKYAGMPRPHLIVLDRVLPKSDGCEVLEAIRQADHLRGVPVVMMTFMAAQGKPAGADLAIVKPLSLDEYLDIGVLLKNLLLKTRTERACEASGS